MWADLALASFRPSNFRLAGSQRCTIISASFELFRSVSACVKGSRARHSLTESRALLQSLSSHQIVLSASFVHHTSLGFCKLYFHPHFVPKIIPRISFPPIARHTHTHTHTTRANMQNHSNNINETPASLSPSVPQTPAKELSIAAKRLSASGQSPIGSERGASPASMTNRLGGSVSTLNSTTGYGPSDESLQARESSSRHSPASSTVPTGADDLAGSGNLDASDQEGIRAVSTRRTRPFPHDL